MELGDIRVYLAGPITNCNERQRTEWRKRLKRQLKSHGFQPLDPTDANARKGALAVATDIEEADVVIANLWRESIGTILGIVQARRSGTPVILIDSNCIDSPVLAELVGKEFVVSSELAALNLLVSTIAPEICRALQLTKKNGATVSFDRRKLHRSLRSIFSQAKVDDPILLSLLIRRVTRTILQRAKAEKTTTKTKDIKSIIFETLTDVSLEKNSAELSRLLKEFERRWGEYERRKDDGRVLDELSHELETLREALQDLEQERNNLEAQLAASKVPILSLDKVAASAVPLCEKISELLGGRKALCIGEAGRSTFKAKLLKEGLSEAEFDQLFDEISPAGRQSNLARDLGRHAASYSYVLYAYEGLRHQNDTTAHAENVLSARSAIDVVRKFLAMIDV